MARTFSNITEAFGNTPLVRLNRVAGSNAEVYAKLEFYNPAGSVKDRIGIAIIDAAEQSGQLQPGGTIVEGTVARLLMVAIEGGDAGQRAAADL